jgi:hypothetical protein
LLLEQQKQRGNKKKTNVTCLKLFKWPRQCSTFKLFGNWLVFSFCPNICSSSPVSDSSLILDIEHRRRYIRWYIFISLKYLKKEKKWSLWCWSICLSIDFIHIYVNWLNSLSINVWCNIMCENSWWSSRYYFTHDM